MANRQFVFLYNFGLAKVVYNPVDIKLDIYSLPFVGVLANKYFFP